jgi:site-specific DNA-methyltransferase (adenine-specific)/site-specific DNA-methyltransferase (cytosine-N4-specific)
MYQDQVRVPIGDWSRTRLANLSETDRVRDPSRTGSGFGKNVSHWVGRETVYPSNVLHLASECSNENHSAVFPRDLPSFFIRLFTIDRDTVLDPFEGSGTTGVVATELRRHYIGVDLHDVNVEVAKRRIRENMGMDDALTEFG